MISPTDWQQYYIDQAVIMFGPRAKCGCCGDFDADMAEDMVRLAETMINYGRGPIAICAACATDVANAYALLHGQDAVTPGSNGWPAITVVPRTSPPRPKIPPSRVLKVFERDGYACLHCGSRSRLTIDHCVPIAEGGGSDDGNLQTLCLPCNSSKGARPNWAGRKAVAS